MPSPYSNMNTEYLQKIRKDYLDQLHKLCNPSTIESSICLGGMLLLMGGVGNLLYDGISELNAALMVAGGCGCYRWANNDKTRLFVEKELNEIEYELYKR